MTPNTSTTASISVLTTSSIDRRTNGEVSLAITARMPDGKKRSSSRIFASAASATASALAPEASRIARPAAGRPLKRASTE